MELFSIRIQRTFQLVSTPFDVTKRKKWADYVAECHATGKEIDYDNYDWDK